MESSGDNDVLPSAMRWAQRTGEFQKAQLEDFRDMIQLCVPPKMKCSKSLQYYAHAPHRPTFNMHVNAPDLLAMVYPRHSQYTLFGDCSSCELFSGFWWVKMFPFGFCRLQRHSHPAGDIQGGRQIDEGAFGSIEKARFHGSKVAVKYVKGGTGKASSVPTPEKECSPIAKLCR